VGRLLQIVAWHEPHHRAQSHATHDGGNLSHFRGDTVTVNTRRVRNRRRLRFHDFDEVQADIAQLRATPHCALGNWSLAQIVMHLGQVMHASIDGSQEPVRFSLPARILGRLLLRPYVIHVAVPRGIRLPPSAAREFFFDEAEFDEALQRFDSAVVRLAHNTPLPPHPLIG
jgi:hypothetical protein